MEVQVDFLHIAELIANAKTRAYQAVNRELVSLYWQIGEYLSQKVKANAWGKSVVNELSEFILSKEPNLKGFTPQNLWRMKQFYEIYCGNEKLATVWRELTWSHHRLIMPCKTAEEREFYLRLSIKERWSVRELERQINSSYFERVMLANAKLAPVSRVLPQDISDSFKDTYLETES